MSSAERAFPAEWKCQYCGRPVYRTDKFCENCGADRNASYPKQAPFQFSSHQEASPSAASPVVQQVTAAAAQREAEDAARRRRRQIEDEQRRVIAEDNSREAIIYSVVGVITLIVGIFLFVAARRWEPESIRITGTSSFVEAEPWWVSYWWVVALAFGIQALVVGRVYLFILRAEDHLWALRMRER